MTLIEVLAGLALLAALLMTVLAARSRAALQWTRANERMRAVEAADRLLSEWWQDARSFPRAGEGVVEGPDGFRWRIRVVSNRPAERLGTEVVRLEVGRFPRGGAESTGPTASAGAVAVEVVLPLEETPGISPAPPVGPERRDRMGGR